jgi:hypothetical protein
MTTPKRAPVRRPTVPETPAARKRGIAPRDARREPSEAPPRPPASVVDDQEDQRPTIRIPRTTT